MQNEKDIFFQNCLAWDRAMEKNNAEEIGSYMANDWICVATDGGITSKAAFLSEIDSGNLSHTKMSSDEHEIRLYDQTAILISKGISSGTYKGEAFTFYEWSTSVFVLKDSQWLCVVTMLTPSRELLAKEI
ncbi:nuclear transport factor 2 family protein [Flavitalea sp.]|nr:nuclear transport factor 2 family protein [Flavitalea sp.]